ncbi:hypothetical protein RND81_06G007500 [Saponaria officinalis]|uniref:Late embryogenesis abundant protein LEA-2 subgroup domain-containing protein n=1 Tax=Saponaria officinalis TaxID=3572 RepID=A0AAW1K5U0_SAPOF
MSTKTSIRYQSIQSNDKNDEDNNGWCSFILGPTDYSMVCVILVSMVLMVLLIFGLEILLLSGPSFKFNLVSVDVASRTISNNSVSADLKVTLNVSYTNEHRDELMTVDPLVVLIKYGDEILSSVKMDPFYAMPQQHKTIQFNINVRAYDLKVVTVDSMAKDLAVNQSIEFIFIFQGRYWVGLTSPRGMLVTCDGVNVKFTPALNFTTGSMIDSQRSCDDVIRSLIR